MPTERRIRKMLPLKLRSAWPSDDLDARESPRCLNVRFKFGEVRESPGRDILTGNQGSETVLGLFRANFQDGTEWAVKLEQTKLFRFGAASPGTPREWHQVQGSGISTSSRRWSAVSAEDRFFFSRGLDTIQRWPAGVGTPGTGTYEVIPASAGTVPKAKFIEYISDHLVAAYTEESGETFASRVRWAASGDHTDWDDTAGTGAGVLDLFEEGSEPIVMLKALGPEGVVYHKSYISHLVPTGVAASAFVEEGRIRGIGTEAGDTVASNGQVHFFLGVAGKVYMWDGVRITFIGGDVEEEIKGLIDPDDMDEYFGYVTQSTLEYWLIIGTHAFVFDINQQTWSRDSYPSLTSMVEVKDTQVVQTWTSSAGTPWSMDFGTWESLAASGAIRIWAGRTNGAVMVIDENVVYDYWAQGSIVDRYVETDDSYIGFNESGMPDPSLNGKLNRVFFIYKYTNTESFIFSVSADKGMTWTDYTVEPNEAGFSYIDMTEYPACNMVRFRFREESADGRFRWRSLVSFIEDAGPVNPSQLE